MTGPATPPEPSPAAGVADAPAVPDAARAPAARDAAVLTDDLPGLAAPGLAASGLPGLPTEQGLPTLPGEEGQDGQEPPRDWPWVERWRESGEPPAYAPGVTLALLVGLIIGLAMLVLGQGLASKPALLLGIDVVIVGGMTPALWLCRGLPVLRFLAAGAAVGLVLGVVVNLMMAF